MIGLLNDPRRAEFNGGGRWRMRCIERTATFGEELAKEVENIRAKGLSMVERGRCMNV